MEEQPDSSVKEEESDSFSATTDKQETHHSGSQSSNIAGVSNAPQHWLPLDIKQEKEEEEEQPISQRGDMLDFTDQNHFKSEMEENQNPEHRTDNSVKEEESDSPSATTDKQGRHHSGSHSSNVAVSNELQRWLLSDIKQEKEEEEEQLISQRGDMLDFTDQNQNQEQPDNPVKKEESQIARSTKQTGLIQHCCQHCDKTFTTSRCLKIHAGEKLHSCEQCGTFFTPDCNVKNHRCIASAEIPDWCEPCDHFTDVGMEGDGGLVAGRSQREKRRSYKDLLREDEEIAALIHKSDSELCMLGGDSHKKKKKPSNDCYYRARDGSAAPPHKTKHKSAVRSSPLSSPSSSHLPKKKNPNAYQVFWKEYSVNINAEQPGLDFGELSKKLGEVWKAMPEKDKLVWRQKARYLCESRNIVNGET